MEAVNAFNHELFSLMDSKPPISRAKMISITKSAIKAMKLYKHVVQIVEKFIKKCKPEYKVAGLYVVDSIVRQSRHQFGADKDVFGPRFTKNITGTFENLCLCPLEDRSKIVRVLNLWQKNGVFKIEVIQPLLGMAAGSSGGTSADTSAEEPGSPPSPANEPVAAIMANSAPTPAPPLQNTDALAAVAQLFQSSHGQQLQQMLQNFQQQPVKPPPQTQSPAPQTQAEVPPDLALSLPNFPLSAPAAHHKTTFDKTLLDRFDYDDEPEGGEEMRKEEGLSSSQTPFMQQPPGFPQHMDQRFAPQMAGMTQNPSQQGSFPPNGQLQRYGLPAGQGYPAMMPPVGQAHPGQTLPGAAGAPSYPGGFPPHNAAQQQQDPSMDMERSAPRDGRHGRRSGSRSPKRRRSRSNSRTRRSRHRRSRSRSRDRRHRSQERREREKERERRQKGLPPPKADTLSVCSTTLWVGQLDKRTQQQDVACLLEELGQIDSINMIPPRGCAYIVMVHRLDAFRALQKLSRGTYKVNQKAIKIAWALNKGIKAEFKQYWDVELGVTYIPWSKIKEDQLEELQEGGMLDADTLSPEWRGVKSSLEPPEEMSHNGRSETSQPEELPGLPVAPGPPPPAQGSSASQPMVGVGSLQPPVFPGPMGMPPPSFLPGIPPPPFLRPGFNPMQMPAGHPGGGPPGGPPGNIQPPPGGLLGARPGIIPLQRPPVLPPPHMQRFPPPHGPRPPHPNMPPMLPQMLHRGPQPPMMHHELPPGGFGMPPPHAMRGPFPPHGPPPPGPPPPFIRPCGPRGLDAPGGPRGLDVPGGPRGLDVPGGPRGLDVPGGPRGLDVPGGPRGLDVPGGPRALDGPGGPRALDGPGGPRAHDGPGVPRGLDGPGVPRGLDGPGVPRGLDGPGVPRGLDGPGVPRGLDGPGVPRGLDGPGVPRGLDGPGVPRGLDGPGVPRGLDAPGGPRALDGPEENDGRLFRGDRPGFRERETERDWNRERERDRGFGGGRRPFGDVARGGGGDGDDRVDGRERLGGWQEDGDGHRGTSWDRDRERRDWRERKGSPEGDRDRGGRSEEGGERDRGRGDGGERGRSRGEGGERERGRGEEGGRAERVRATDGKDGDRPRRRERSTRWDRDNRLAELESMERFRNADSVELPSVVAPVAPVPVTPTPVTPAPVARERCAESTTEPSKQKAESASSASAAPLEAEPVTSDPPAPTQSDITATTQGAES